MGLTQRIQELDMEIEGYRQAILDAEGALDSAEKELNEVLSEIESEDDVSLNEGDLKIKFFGDLANYNKFIAAMERERENGTLPAVINMDETSSISLKDVKDVINLIRENTGLEAEATFYTCDSLDDLHMMLIIGIVS